MYKAAVTTWRRKNSHPNFQWQRNYYEHIIRNEKDLYNIRSYIRNNLLKRYYDEENPNNIKVAARLPRSYAKW